MLKTRGSFTKYKEGTPVLEVKVTRKKDYESIKNFIISSMFAVYRRLAARYKKIIISDVYPTTPPKPGTFSFQVESEEVGDSMYSELANFPYWVVVIKYRDKRFRFSIDKNSEMINEREEYEKGPGIVE